MTGDDAKKKILARRASFVAAALASVACQKEPADKPEPCLAAPVNYKPPDAGEPEPTPMPCLTPMNPGPSHAADAGAPASSAPTADAGRPVPPPQPQPCLTPMRPEDVKKK